MAWPEYSIHEVEITGNTVMYFTQNQIFERSHEYIYRYFCFPDDGFIFGIRSPESTLSYTRAR